jgi:transcriptional regulator with XRE-family HTH domain
MRKLINTLEGNPVQKKEREILIRIKNLRLEKKMSQYALGEKIGISQNAYYKIEKGATRLDLQRLIQLSFIFEIELCKLVC